MDSGLGVPVFNQGDDPIACLRRAMSFSHNCSLFKSKRLRNAVLFKEKEMLAEAQEAGQTKDLDAYDSDCNDVSNAKVVLMANLSNYGSDVISKLQTSHLNIDQSASSPVKTEAPKELHKTNSVLKFIRKNFSLKMIDSYKKSMSQDVIICVMNSTTVFDDVHLEIQTSESCVKCLDLDAKLLNKQNAYNDLLKSYLQLEKHYISLELTLQLSHKFFQKDSLSNNQNALEILEYFENNDLKAQLQAKDTTIYKLKEHIKSIRETDKEEKVKQEMVEIETINIELQHSVAKLLFENERKIYKDQYDSIKKTRALLKEHDDSLIAQLNSKSMENLDLKRQL
uniref:Uncharacterized protein n=1 Tax=Tanacetum cinerariifolium TaxID=118510 RepID=A0A6L2L7N7_TANCI|nr:hypothetical protein [Tanacetum cinerariifolium]